MNSYFYFENSIRVLDTVPISFSVASSLQELRFLTFVESKFADYISVSLKSNIFTKKFIFIMGTIFNETNYIYRGYHRWAVL